MLTPPWFSPCQRRTIRVDSPLLDKGWVCEGCIDCCRRCGVGYVVTAPVCISRSLRSIRVGKGQCVTLLGGSPDDVWVRVRVVRYLLRTLLSDGPRSFPNSLTRPPRPDQWSLRSKWSRRNPGSFLSPQKARDDPNELRCQSPTLSFPSPDHQGNKTLPSLQCLSRCSVPVYTVPLTPSLSDSDT